MSLAYSVTCNYCNTVKKFSTAKSIEGFYEISDQVRKPNGEVVTETAIVTCDKCYSKRHLKKKETIEQTNETPVPSSEKVEVDNSKLPEFRLPPGIEMNVNR